MENYNSLSLCLLKENVSLNAYPAIADLILNCGHKSQSHKPMWVGALYQP
jgi:hypothetical protein